MEQAEQLSKAGERLVPALAQHWTLDLEKASETVRAASLVGGPAALDLIEQVVGKVRAARPGAFDSEVSRAWQYFDIDEYARRVLVRLRPAAILVADIRNVVQPLTQVLSLRTITVEPFEGTVSLQDWAALPDLRLLVFYGLESGQLQGLEVCRQITDLRLVEYESFDFSNFGWPPFLKSLEIASSSSLKTLKGLIRATSLERIVVKDCPVLTDVQGYDQLPNLTDAAIQTRYASYRHKDGYITITKEY
jgi:hypothetical protein